MLALSYQEERKQRRYIGSVSLAGRYDKSIRTIQRWLVVPPPGFPKPRKHHGRWLWDVEELDAYDDALAQKVGA